MINFITDLFRKLTGLNIKEKYNNTLSQLLKNKELLLEHKNIKLEIVDNKCIATAQISKQELIYLLQQEASYLNKNEITDDKL